MQVTRQDEVIAGVAGSLPDSRVMSTEDTHMALVVRGSLRTRDRDHSPAMGHARNAVVNPLPAAQCHRLADGVHADLAIVVSANSQHGCDCMESADQAAQLGQLGALIHQVAAQEHHIRIAAGHRLYNLAAQSL